MFMFKRANGIYYIVYLDLDRKRKYISTKSRLKSEALKFLSEIKEEIKSRKLNKVIPITLKDFRFKILKRSELQHAPKTTKVYYTTFKFFIKYFGNIQINDINKVKVKEYLDYRILNTSVYAARKDLINLKASFFIAVEEKYLVENPCVGIKQFKLPEKQPLFFSKNDFEKLCSTIYDKEYRDLVKLAVNTGMRMMELLTLTWQQINLEEKLITLDNRVHITKSKRIRTIPINHNIYQLLLNRNKSQTSDTVFNYKGSRVDCEISHRFKTYVLKANLNSKYHFHTLRHTFATWLVQSGVSIYFVSKLLGHADIKTTEIYAHFKNDDLQKAVSCL